MSLSLSYRRLLQDAFVAAIPIYIPLLVFSLPGLLLTLLIGFTESVSLTALYNTVLYFLITPWMSGAAIHYTYQMLSRKRGGMREAVQQSGKKIAQLIIGYITVIVILIPAFMLFFIPGIYLGVRLSFFFYGIVIDDLSAVQGIRQSWNLVKGHWWQVFIGILVIALALFLPILLIAVMAGVGSAIAGSEPGGSPLLPVVLGFLLSPIATVYFVLLYQFLRV